MDARKRIEELAREVLRHQYLYYVEAKPEIPDSEYDRLYDELLGLEKRFPGIVLENSPTRRVGSDLDNTFPEKAHTIPVLSLDKEYTLAGLEKWVTKTAANAQRSLSFVVEEKIDGASIVLYYREGMLSAALTRGNGLAGNEVTENIRTIKQIPLITGELTDFAVRGEIYIKKSDFERFNRQFENKYSNPRNLAAGSLRNLKSAIVAQVPLNILVYEGYFQPDRSLTEHIWILSRLKDLHFRINRDIGFFSAEAAVRAEVAKRLPGIRVGPITGLTAYVQERMEKRDGLDHEIDGLVVKVNEIDVRDSLGYTSHHPRWAVAFKFDAPTAQTVVKDILIQVGRNGRVTPVAVLEPVKIAGSVVSRATLHNQEYIDLLELGFGDTVAISKRGDIIPAVEEVIEKAPDNPSIFKYPEICPFCKSPLVKDGAHHFCKNRDCPERSKRAIIYFVGKDQMDVDTLGEKTIEFLYNKGFIKGIPDIYTFDYRLLLDEEGFKDKKIDNITRSLEKSKSQPFKRVLASLGFDGLGKTAASDLIKNGFYSIDLFIDSAAKGRIEDFTRIDGFAETTAGQLIAHFTDERNLALIGRLRALGLNFEEQGTSEAKTPEEMIFQDQTWVITGSFEHFEPREKAALEIEKRGGKVVSAISSKTTHLLVGASPGSKLDKAKALNTRIVSEPEFLQLLALKERAELPGK